MKIISKFTETARNVWRDLKATKREKKSHEDEVRSCLELNVTEFNGRLYISCGNVPVVRGEQLKEDATRVLSQSRKDYLQWKEFYKSR